MFNHLDMAEEHLVQWTKDHSPFHISESMKHIRAHDEISELSKADTVIDQYHQQCTNVLSSLEAACMEIARLKQVVTDNKRFVRCVFNNQYYAVKGSGTHLDANGGHVHVIILEEVFEHTRRDVRLEPINRFYQDYVNV